MRRTSNTAILSRRFTLWQFSGNAKGAKTSSSLCLSQGSSQPKALGWKVF
ncbi:UNVERIFIED_ORG: hypothetical protein J2W85_002549 [Ensifer adhaerens]|jgi:hypothetical protein|nr:hypothetical protein [Ensifer adhaerens]